MGKRVTTVAVILPLFLAALFYLPNVYWMVALLAVLAVAAGEWCALAGFTQYWKWGFFGAVLLPCLAVAVFSLHISRAYAGWFDAVSLGFWLFVAPIWLALRWKVTSPLALAAAGWAVLAPTWYALAVLQLRPQL